MGGYGVNSTKLSPMNTTTQLQNIRSQSSALSLSDENVLSSSNAMSEINSIFYEEPKSQHTARLSDDEFEVMGDDDMDLQIGGDTAGGLIGDDEFEIVDEANLTKQ